MKIHFNLKFMSKTTWPYMIFFSTSDKSHTFIPSGKLRFLQRLGGAGWCWAVLGGAGHAHSKDCGESRTSVCPGRGTRSGHPRPLSVSLITGVVW